MTAAVLDRVRPPSTASVIAARLGHAAQALGIGDPAPALATLLGETFARPGDDPVYRGNHLLPGALPLEWSFAEDNPDALRFEMQPCDPSMRPAERLAHAIAAIRALAAADQGEAAAARLADMAGAVGSPRDFGAFLGFAFHARRRTEYKIYLEAGQGEPALLPGTTPHFHSLSLGPNGLAQRHYHLCSDGLRLLDLEPLCDRLGLSHHFPSLIVMLLDLTDGAFHLPPRSALLGVRGGELKVELVVGSAAEQAGLSTRIAASLSPGAGVSFRRWAALVAPAGRIDPLLRVVSIRVRADAPLSISVYAAEADGPP
ncbi:MAG: hypothetical protein ABW184_05300 [Sphingobium sp.]